MMKERLWILLGKKINGEIDAEELAELEQLLRHSGEITFTGELMERFWKTPLEPTQADQSEAENWAAIERGIAQKEGVIRSMRETRRWVWVAASLVLLITAGAGVYRWSHGTAVQSAETASVVATRSNSRSRLSLPDGTTVWLNGDSRISYNQAFGDKKREITLEGEAFFDVAAHPEVPLVVHASGLNIRVLGTAFNVSIHDGQVITSLIRGSVELSASSRPGWKVILKPNQKISVSPEKVDSSHLVALHEEPRSKLIPEVSWVNNKLVFYQEPFGSLAARMGKWYGVYFNIEDEHLEKVTLTGVFDKESLSQALTALQWSCRFHYVIKDDTVTVTR